MLNEKTIKHNAQLTGSGFRSFNKTPGSIAVFVFDESFFFFPLLTTMNSVCVTCLAWDLDGVMLLRLKTFRVNHQPFLTNYSFSRFYTATVITV